MITYPSIPSPGLKGGGNIRKFKGHIIAFDKLDGSNLRAEFTPKRGFHKFGRRRGLLDDSHPILGARGQAAIMNKFGESLDQIFRAQRWQKATAFFEFYGPSSFAGTHDPDEEQTVTLIDVHVYKRGMLEPQTFLDLFGHLDIPAVLYRGPLDGDFRDKVYSGDLEGMTFEGVVCKGARFKGKPYMSKLKTKAWYDRLKRKCGDDAALFKRLA